MPKVEENKWLKFFKELQMIQRNSIILSRMSLHPIKLIRTKQQNVR
jgi:hypothetical protein